MKKATLSFAALCLAAAAAFTTLRAADAKAQTAGAKGTCRVQISYKSGQTQGIVIEGEKHLPAVPQMRTDFLRHAAEGAQITGNYVIGDDDHFIVRWSEVVSLETQYDGK